MAKGQKRSTREVKKPKAKKPAAPAAGSAMVLKGTQITPGASKAKTLSAKNSKPELTPIR